MDWGTTRRGLFGIVRAPRADVPPHEASAPPPSGGWEAVDEVCSRVRLALPSSSSGDAEMDFALAAAPLAEALADLSARRAEAGGDPALKEIAARMAAARDAEVQALIDWMSARGHASG